MRVETYTLENLKNDYITRNGFVLTTPDGVSISDSSIKRYCNSLIKGYYTTKLPEFIVRLTPQKTVIVYNIGISISSGDIFKQAQIGYITGFFHPKHLNIDMLASYLKEN